MWGFTQVPPEKVDPWQSNSGIAISCETVRCLELNGSCCIPADYCQQDQSIHGRHPHVLSILQSFGWHAVLSRGPASKTHKWIWDWGYCSVHLCGIYKTLTLRLVPRKMIKISELCPVFLINEAYPLPWSLIHETVLENASKKQITSCDLSKYSVGVGLYTVECRDWQ